MGTEIDGDSNIVSGRDVYVNRIQTLNNRVDRIDEIFLRIDQNFAAVTGSIAISRKDEPLRFSSEALCTSLVTIGIPISVALDVVESIMPLPRNLLEQKEGAPTVMSTNDVKVCTLQALVGLQFRGSRPGGLNQVSHDEISTWSTAYVRRYGGSDAYLQIIDYDKVCDLNFDYLKEVFIPHLIESIVGSEKGVDAIRRYRVFFSESVIKRMALEIMGFAKALNVYSIRYKTLFHLSRDIILYPPHPWMVVRETITSIVLYNIERGNHHLQFITSSHIETNPEYFSASAYECAAHFCASILAHYGCLLGLESRYGLSEFIRICDIKKQNKNIVMWEFCGLATFEDDLAKMDISLASLTIFLKRLLSSLSISYSAKVDIIGMREKCVHLKNIALKLTEQTC